MELCYDIMGLIGEQVEEIRFRKKNQEKFRGVLDNIALMGANGRESKRINDEHNRAILLEPAWADHQDQLPCPTDFECMVGALVEWSDVEMVENFWERTASQKYHREVYG
jgi:hypothetical protein